ncbi:MAG: 16S rRNA (adenine1518-N6/adenine1519-N6)-dimethyltransferase [Parasphingorhabdus sp.]|jgi:16S rRNA (adenine1518-N6/adenine1519-N6)-dimethyltransferase
MARAKKSLGQNFLTDSVAVHRIVRSFDAKVGQQIIEIGPGRGALTSALIASSANVIAVEFDRDMVAVLEQKYSAATNFSLLQGDILRTQIDDCFPAGPVRIIGNLPYNISSPILFHLLDQKNRMSDCYFMLQREVVERIVASPGNKQYGRPSVVLQRSFEVSTDISISPESFTPPPKVHSAMLRMIPRATPLGGDLDEKQFRRLTTAAFSQRRKTLRNTLKGLLSKEQIESAGIDPGARAETLDVLGFAALTRLLEVE